MDDQKNTLSYHTPLKTGPRRFPIAPWVAFLVAVASFAAAQFIWFTGVFGDAHRDDVAQVSVLCAGAIVAFASCVGGFYQPIGASTRRHALGFLFGFLDLLAGCFFVYVVVAIRARM